MKTSPFLEYIIYEVLQDKPGLDFKRMMGGFILSYQGSPFGIVSGNKLYFRVDDRNRPDYIQAGSKQFSYKRQGKEIALNLWEVPSELIAEPNEKIWTWIEKSMQVPSKGKNR
ncbi:MAG: hypothetical protein OHK0017_13330 [Patescibacteria group bacterium]